MGKLAIIELNENALKLSIFKTNSGRFTLMQEISEPVNIAQEIVSEELLRPKTKNTLVDILKIYRKLIETYKVEKIVAVASGILARARNYRGFIEEAYNNTAISFSILSEEDVIKNVYTSTVNSIDNSKGFLININSFSTNFVKYNRRAIVSSVTIPFGSVNLLTNEKGDKLDFLQMYDLVKKEVINRDIKKNVEDESEFVGSGSAFISIGRIAKKIARYPLDLDNNYPISASLLKQTVDFVKGLDLEKVNKIKGIDESQAESILSASAIISAFYDVLEINELSVSSACIRDGIVYNNTSLSSQEKFNDLLANSLDNYFEFTKDEYSINPQVYSMALILFKQLKVMHKLPRFYVKPLRIASFMYDCGKNINVSGYEKHGLQTILNSGIKGVSHHELVVAGFICLCQNPDAFSLNEWMQFKDIVTEEDLDAVRKLGVIVKLADALNISRKVVITDVVCDILGDSIIMKTVVEGDASFEIMEGMKVARDYKKVFKKSLQII